MDATQGRTRARKRVAATILSGLVACVAFHLGASAAEQVPASRQEALQRAQAFFAARADDLDLESYLVYRHLERRYGVAPVAFDMADAKLEADEQEIEPFLRLLDPEVDVDADRIDRREGRIDHFTLQALYCDRHPLSADFVATLGEFSRASGYRLTHSMIAIQWLRENECAAGISESVARAEARAIQGLSEFCDGQAEVGDRYVEAVAVLYYTGHDDRVRESWIDKIVAAQQANGGWRDSFHTSVLALWVLLEANAVREDPTQGWIPRAPRLRDD